MWMSPRTFARRFAAETGTAPYKWLLQPAVSAAARSLETTDLSLDEVARRVGLGTPYALRHHFKALRGRPLRTGRTSPGSRARTWRPAPDQAAHRTARTSTLVSTNATRPSPLIALWWLEYRTAGRSHARRAWTPSNRLRDQSRLRSYETPAIRSPDLQRSEYPAGRHRCTDRRAMSRCGSAAAWSGRRLCLHTARYVVPETVLGPGSGGARGRPLIVMVVPSPVIVLPTRRCRANDCDRSALGRVPSCSRRIRANPTRPGTRIVDALRDTLVPAHVPRSPSSTITWPTALNIVSRPVRRFFTNRSMPAGLR